MVPLATGGSDSLISVNVLPQNKQHMLHGTCVNAIGVHKLAYSLICMVVKALIRKAPWPMFKRTPRSTRYVTAFNGKQLTKRLTFCLVYEVIHQEIHGFGCEPQTHFYVCLHIQNYHCNRMLWDQLYSRCPHD